METGYPWSSESFIPGSPSPISQALFTEPSPRYTEIDLKYEFAHDKVQEACHDMIPAEQLPATHILIGRNLKAFSSQKEELLFEVCNHFAIGKDFLKDDEQREIAIFNLHVARIAIKRTAFDHALRYSLASRAFAKSLNDEMNESFKFDVTQVLVQSLFSLARYEEALVETDLVLKSHLSDSSIIAIGVEKVRVLRSLGRNREAYEQGMNTIKMAGLRVPEDVWDIGQVLALTTWYKAGFDTMETMKVSHFHCLILNAGIRISTGVGGRSDAIFAATDGGVDAFSSNGSADSILPRIVYLRSRIFALWDQRLKRDIFAYTVCIQPLQS